MSLEPVTIQLHIQCALIATVIAILCCSNTIQELYPAKYQVPNTWTKHNGQEYPPIECHHCKHQEVGHTHLNHLKYGLDDMDEQWQLWLPKEYRSPAKQRKAGLVKMMIYLHSVSSPHDMHRAPRACNWLHLLMAVPKTKKDMQWVAQCVSQRGSRSRLGEWSAAEWLSPTCCCHSSSFKKVLFDNEKKKKVEYLEYQEILNIITIK